MNLVLDLDVAQMYVDDERFAANSLFVVFFIGRKKLMWKYSFDG
ncbi:TipAS antibiotic-recognition domain-containing protein [Planococcus salinarum]|nr:TipAS antibiotic-recognition domain-containing protein [Planococcus salinarum]